jgi:hypothetical protein
MSLAFEGISKVHQPYLQEWIASARSKPAHEEIYNR